MTPFRIPTRTAALLLGGVLLTGSLAACGDDATTASSGTGTSTSAGSPTTAQQALTVTDGWAKAADTGMTAAFGTLHNETDKDIVITGGTSPAAGMVETHIMVEGDGGEMVMKKSTDGFTVPAKGTFDLEPGGPHLMLMNLKKPVKAGEDVEITVSTADAQKVSLTFAGREFTGAEESYAPEEHGTEMDHGSESSSH